MKRLLFSTLFVLTAIVGWAQTTFTEGNFTYTVTDEENHEVSIAKAAEASLTGALVIPSSVTYEAVTYAVTRIDAEAFKNSSITSVSIPASVLTIGNEAFNFISTLVSVRIEDGDTPLTLENDYWGAFQNGDSWGVHYTKAIYLGRNIVTSVADRSRTEFDTVEELTIGPKVTALGDNAFNGCLGLASVDMSNATSLTSIGVSAFYGCSNLASIDLSQLQLTTISDNTFYNCSKLTSITIPSTVTRIGAAAFKYSGLTSVSIPASVLTIGNEAFNFINALASVRIEDGDMPLTLENDNYGAFQNGDSWGTHYTKTIYLGRNIVTSVENRLRTEFDTVEELTIGPKVTALGDNAFNGCSGLASVDMSNATSLTSIGVNAFYGCSNLASIDHSQLNLTTIGEGAFYGCSKLTTLDLGTKLTAIPANMLYNCTALTSITIPASVQSVGSQAFYNCDGLTSITIEDSETALLWNGTDYHPLDQVNSNYTLYLGRNLTTAANWCFFPGATSVEIGDQVTVVNPSLFNGATKLASVMMGSGVTTIGASAFQNTGTDESVTAQSISLGANVTTIGDYAFYNCSKLTTLDLGTSLTAIPANMLYNCIALTSITIPASVQSVGSEAFFNCDGLTSITIEDSETALLWNGTDYNPLNQVSSNYTLYLGRNLTTAANWCFFPGATSVEIGDQVTVVNPSLFNGATKLASVTMGSGVTTIGASAFQNTGTDESVTAQSISLGANVTTIGDYAFYNCNKLTTLDLGTKLTAIPANMLYNCTALTSITIPASVQSVGSEAFYNCDGLTSITIEDSETALQWNGTDYHPLNQVNSNYTLYLGRNLTTAANWCFFPGATSVEFGPQVTSINPNLFQGCASLSNINMTNATSLTSIGAYAFDGAGNGDSVDELTVTLGSSLTTIGARAFDNCDKINTITIPASVTTIEASAFWNMEGDLNLTIEDSETPLTINAEDSYYPIFEYKNITGYIGRHILRTGNYENEPVFNTSSYYQHHLTFGPKVTAIGDKEYYDCDALRTVSGMSNVVSIGQEAFKTCSNLTSVELGTKLTTMGDYAFQECEKLESIVIPGTLKKIPTEAFENCLALASVTLSDGVEEIGNGAFYDTDALTEITIPASVKKVGRAPFYCNDAQAMKRMIIADSDEPLEFANGKSEYDWGRDNITDDITLDYFYLGRDVARERNDQSLVYEAKEIEIGPKVTTISDTNGLFYKTEKITSIKVHALTPFAINDDDFYESANIYTDATLQVPGGTKEAYAAADGWKKFTNIDHWSTLVTLTATNHGSIATAEATASNGSEQYRQPKTDAVVYTLTADEGYELTALTDNEEAVSPLPALGEQQTRTNAEGEEFVTLNATFSAISYTLNYELAGGSVATANPANYTIESAAITLNNPTKNGYTFSGWKLNGEGEAMMTVTIAKGSTGNKSYTATWTPIEYQIALTLDGGSAENPATYTIESEAITLTNPTKTGHTFKGWKLNGEGDALMEVTIAHGSTGDKAYTATWQINQYTISFNSNGGTEVDAIKQDYASEVTAPDDPTRTGYTFAGWTPAVPETIPAENIELTAQWTINQYTITFNSNGGTEVDAIQQNYASEVTAPANPTREGYTFAGWDAEIPATIPAQNVTINATWTAIVYTLSYNLDGGDVATANPTNYTIESENFTLNNPTRDGYDFLGWTGTGLDAATESVVIATGSTGDRSYTATWGKKSFTVSITGGGVTADNYSPMYGDNVVITIEEDEDRTLNTLTVNGDDVTAEVADNQYTISNVTGNVTVVATFNATKEFITLATSTATFSCPQDLNFTGSDLKAYIAAGYNKSENTVLLVRVYDVPSGTGLILKGTEESTYKIPYTTSQSYYVNMLKAKLTAGDVAVTEGEKSNFLLNKDAQGVFGFYAPSATATLGAQKAYLQVPTTFVAGAREVHFIFEEDAITGIDQFEMLGGRVKSNSMYNLNGQKVENPQTKGVYIVNGKKRVIK